MAGCVVQPQQPAPPPKPTPPVTAPPPLPPSTPPITPKVYSGSYIERLEAASRDTVAGMSISVVRNGNSVKLIIPASVAFAVNSAQLQPRFSAVLDNIGKLCRDYNKTAISIKGFTDSTGSFEHNQELSEQRAASIGAYLGRTVAPARIQTVGYGPRYPIADNKTDGGRMQNRRVEIEMAVTP